MVGFPRKKETIEFLFMLSSSKELAEVMAPAFIKIIFESKNKKQELSQYLFNWVYNWVLVKPTLEFNGIDAVVKTLEKIYDKIDYNDLADALIEELSTPDHRSYYEMANLKDVELVSNNIGIDSKSPVFKFTIKNKFPQAKLLLNLLLQIKKTD